MKECESIFSSRILEGNLVYSEKTRGEKICMIFFCFFYQQKIMHDTEEEMVGKVIRRVYTTYLYPRVYATYLYPTLPSLHFNHLTDRSA